MVWLQQNLSTIVVCVILLVLIFLAIRKLVKDKKKGIGSCGHDCSKCHGGCGSCK